jgi:hypothetical protein
VEQRSLEAQEFDERARRSYEITPANVADLSLTEELLAEAKLLGGELARKLLGDLAYRSHELEGILSSQFFTVSSHMSKYTVSMVPLPQSTMPIVLGYP